MSEEIPAGFLDARGIEDDREIDCDVCVVGSGAAGTTLALRLRDRGRSVLLLEGGGARSDPETASLYDLDTDGLPIGAEARQRFLGGTTNAWWGGSVMLEESDFAARPWLSAPAWPIDRNELLPYYAEGCAILGIPDLTRVGAGPFRSGHGFLVRTPELETVALYWPKRPRRFGELLAPAVREARGLQTFLFANVTAIVSGADGEVVDCVDVRTVSGRRFRVRPKTVVLACGGIENARLLLASAGGGGGLGTGRDVVGRFFMDHPKGVVGVVHIEPGVATLPHAAYWTDHPGSFRLGIRLSAERQTRDGLLDGYVRFHPALASAGRGSKAMRALYRLRLRALRSRTVMRDLALGLPGSIALARFRVFNRGHVLSAEIQNFLEQEPRRENRVTLSDRTDRFGNPLARLEWSIGDLDRRSTRALHAAVDEEFRRRGFGHVESPLLSGEDDQWPISRDASHHMGTTRMGDDPSTSAVDRDCRVHGIANLYVAGSSVFPTSGYANPTLTIVALALRLGDHLGAIGGSGPATSV